MGSLIHDFGPTLGIVVGFVIQALILHGKRESEITTIREWMQVHQKEADSRDASISELKTIAAAMKATAEGQDRRLELLEERKRIADWTHGG